MTSRDARFVVCPADQLANGQHLKLKLLFEALSEECIVFRFEGKVYAYINRCVHMPRKLDCEKDQIFDKSGRFLRCSMHGIVYQPETGASVSTICEGERLRAVALCEEDGEVVITDFRVSSVMPACEAG